MYMWQLFPVQGKHQSLRVWVTTLITVMFSFPRERTEWTSSCVLSNFAPQKNTGLAHYISEWEFDQAESAGQTGVEAATQQKLLCLDAWQDKQQLFPRTCDNLQAGLWQHQSCLPVSSTPMEWCIMGMHHKPKTLPMRSSVISVALCEQTTICISNKRLAATLWHCVCQIYTSDLGFLGQTQHYSGLSDAQQYIVLL